MVLLTWCRGWQVSTSGRWRRWRRTARRRDNSAEGKNYVIGRSAEITIDKKMTLKMDLERFIEIFNPCAFVSLSASMIGDGQSNNDVYFSDKPLFKSFYKLYAQLILLLPKQPAYICGSRWRCKDFFITPMPRRNYRKDGLSRGSNPRQYGRQYRCTMWTNENWRWLNRAICAGGMSPAPIGR